MDSYNETTIDHISGDKFCGVSTGERAIKSRLEKLAAEYPDEVELVALNQDGSVFYHIPWKWIKIHAPRRLTDEQLAACRERGKKLVEFNQQFK